MEQRTPRTKNPQRSSANQASNTGFTPMQGNNTPRNNQPQPNSQVRINEQHVTKAVPVAPDEALVYTPEPKPVVQGTGIATNSTQNTTFSHSTPINLSPTLHIHLLTRATSQVKLLGKHLYSHSLPGYYPPNNGNHHYNPTTINANTGSPIQPTWIYHLRLNPPKYPSGNPNNNLPIIPPQPTLPAPSLSNATGLHTLTVTQPNLPVTQPPATQTNHPQGTLPTCPPSGSPTPTPIRGGFPVTWVGLVGSLLGHWVVG